MNFQHALSPASYANAPKITQKTKANRKNTTISLSDIFHRSSAQGSALPRATPNSLHITSTTSKVHPKPNAWAASNSSLSNPSPPVSLVAVMNELAREEQCGANNTQYNVAVNPPSTKLVSPPELPEASGPKIRLNLPAQPPPVPPPPSTKKKGKKAPSGALSDVIPAYPRDDEKAAVAADKGRGAGVSTVKEIGYIQSHPDSWPSEDEDEWVAPSSVPSRLRHQLPAQPPSIPSPPSKDKVNHGKGTKKVNQSLHVPLHETALTVGDANPSILRVLSGGAPVSQTVKEHGWEVEVEEVHVATSLGLRSKNLPSGPPEVLPPPGCSKKKPAGGKQVKSGDQKKESIGKPASPINPWLSPPEASDPVRPTLPAERRKAHNDSPEDPIVDLPPSLRRVLPTEPPSCPLPPSLAKKQKKKKGGKHTEEDPLALFGGADDKNSGVNKITTSVPRTFKCSALPSIDEDEVLPVNVPERLRPKLPTEPPAIPAPPSPKTPKQTPGSARKSKGQKVTISVSVSAPAVPGGWGSEDQVNSPWSPVFSPVFSPWSYEDDVEWGPEPQTSTSPVPKHLRPVLPDGPPAIAEPPALKNKQKTGSRRYSEGSQTLPPSSPDGFNRAFYDFYDLDEILNNLASLDSADYLCPPSPFSDEDTLVSSPLSPTSPHLAPISRNLPDQPPSVQPPPLSPSMSRKGSKKRRRSSASETNPHASFIPAYAREESREDGVLSPSSSDGLSRYFDGDQRERVRNLRRDYAARTRGLRELQEERQKARKGSGKGYTNGASAHWHIRWENAKMHAFNAAREMVKGTRLMEWGWLLTYDLHGLMAEEARRIVPEILEEEYHRSEAESSPLRIKFVTGRGAHSINEAKVKPAVQETLDDHGWDYDEEAGCFIINGRDDSVDVQTVIEEPTDEVRSEGGYSPDDYDFKRVPHSQFPAFGAVAV